ncbi:glycoside hydrolase family 88/105 protein [Coriobacterium glomerans]|uniref:glycoside hydrolase family 88/105 protein n=1 Tax=Coriobacterium glomerans TaxID=33871 RepID=UPI001C11CDEF|nr:glycoside hydrolase family 88 protein [Coriobacterium glomerans]
MEKNINTAVQMLTLAYLYEETHDKAYLSHLCAWGDWLYYDLPRTQRGGFQHVTYGDLNQDEMWVDTLMMSILTLAKLGKVLHRPEYTEEAKKQVLLHIQFLQDKKTGLWFHGWSFLRNDNFSGAFWGRGNSWVTISFPELLDLLDLPRGDSFQEYLTTILKFQVEALENYQDESGLWHTLIDDSSSYLEGSATAGFSYGILKAVHDHRISRRHRETAMKGIQALLDNIDDTGVLGRTSGGTPIGETKEFYNDVQISAMPYGQSMAALALTEYLKEFY